MEQWYKCPKCGADLLYGTDPCPSCKCSLVWSQQGPKLYMLQQQQVIQPVVSSHQSTTIPKSNWDGQLPPYVAKNVEIWWELFPHIKPVLPSKIFSLFGGAKESPPRETIGKVVTIADLKTNLSFGKGIVGLGRASLLNDWGCMCIMREDRLAMQHDYMTGTNEPIPPGLIFSVPWGLFGTVGSRFTFQVDKSLKLSEMERHKYDDNLLKTFKELGYPVDNNSECNVNISKFQHGSWENGLDITFKAAIWLTTNQEEALANIWKIKGS